MADPAHSRRLFLLAAGLLLAGAAWLRGHQIDRRPLHADEAVQAYQTWQLLRGDGYTYDPADKHGPFLYYTAAGVAQAAGWTPATLSAPRLRSVTLLAGLGTLAVLLGAARRLGSGPVLIGAAVVTTAPLAVIYDTYYVQEAWFCFLTWALFFATLRLFARPTPSGALLAGALAGLLQATKETSVLHFAALGVALPVFLWARKSARAAEGGTRPPDGFAPPATRPETGFHLLLALLAAVLVYVLFYSAGFTRWNGVVDGLRTYFTYAARAADSAHEHPWYYYLAMLWPHTRAGTHWGEPVLLVLALAGTVRAFSSRANPDQRAVAVFTLALLAVYSVIPYKTPWLLLTPYAGLALLAGLGATSPLPRWPVSTGRWVAAGLALAVVLECAWRDQSALDRYANDDRNPYVYQPTSPDVTRLVQAVDALPAGQKVAIVSPDHAWPLPWYLRARPATGYFSTAPTNLGAYDVVVFDSRLAALPPAAATAFGLRPNVLLWFAPR